MDEMVKAAKQIVKELKDAGHEAVFAGGCVRDSLLGLEPKDIDIATSASPDEVEALFKRTLPTGKQFGVINVFIGDEEFEVATFRMDSSDSDGRRPNSVEFSSMEEDAKRRDLTINGLFMDPVTEEIFDFVGGKEDLEHEIIQFIGDAQERIDEDRLRMLRAVRFTSRLNFEMEPGVMKVLRRNASRIVEVSPERIKDELDKMMKMSHPSIAFNLLRESGLLKHILPEVDALFGSKHSARWHAEGPDVWTHVMLVLDEARANTSDLPTLWAALLHDIGKPATAALNEAGDINNHGHDAVGAEMAELVMVRLKSSTKDKDIVVGVVGDHMKAHIAKDMRKSRLRRLVAVPHFEQLLVVSSADSNASKNRDIEDADKHKGNSSIFLAEFAASVVKEEGGLKLPKAFVNGNDLIKMGLKPGPKFKELLHHIASKQFDGEVLDRAEALKVLEELV